MANVLLPFFILFLVSTFENSNGKRDFESELFLLRYSDVRPLENHVISIKSVTCIFDCAQHCLDHSYCKGFNFKPRSKSQEINCQLTSKIEQIFYKSEGAHQSWMFYHGAPEQISNTKAAIRQSKKVIVSNETWLDSKILFSGGGEQGFEYLVEIDSWVPKLNDEEAERPLRLCWRASEHGWDVANFHAGCDDKGPTLTIVQVKDYIFGGYANASWKVPELAGLGQKSAPGSFIFSLKNKDDLKPFIAPLQDDNDKSAIVAGANVGPVFGFFDDLAISNHANKNNESTTNFGYTYKTPAGYLFQDKETLSLLAGSQKFSPTEVEVYYHQQARPKDNEDEDN